jgi:PLP dependent protein
MRNDDEIRSLLADRLADVRRRIAAVGRDPATVTLVAVTKTVSARVARLLPELGVPDLGENRPQELWKKAAEIPTARWHLIGHLQRNKLDRTVPGVVLIHSVDSERLLAAVNEFGLKRSSPVPLLLEVNCSRETAKSGFPPRVEEMPVIGRYPGVEVRGLMTMAAYSDDPESSRSTFAELRRLRDDLRSVHGRPLDVLSMGMSNDFEVAVQEGATHIRVGTALFDGLENE